MAGFHCAASASALGYRCRRSFAEVLYSRKFSLVTSCVSTSVPFKTTRRKNHLREKILKTLKQPNIPIPSLIQIDSAPLEEVDEFGTIQEVLESEKCENSDAGNEEVQISEELGEVEVSVPAGNGIDGSIGALDKNSIRKFGWWFIGAFVFQTVCAIWVFGSSGIRDKNLASPGNEESPVIELGGNGKDKSSVRTALKGNGNIDSIVYLDELEMERKIEEIRVMAREVREKERLESEKNGYDSENSEEETDGEKYSKSGIEQEVDNRLIRLRKKLENARKKTPVASVGYLVKDGMRKPEVEKGESDEGEGSGALLFRKKYKFRGLSTDPAEKPKGFTGLDDYYRVNNSKGDEPFESRDGDNGPIALGGGGKLSEVSDVDSKGSDEIHVVEEYKEKDDSEVSESTENARRNVVKEMGMSKQGKGKGASKPKVVDGVLQKKNSGRSTRGAVKSSKVNAKGLQSRKSNDLDIAVASNKLSKGNNGLKDRVGDSKTNPWWSTLPYVLVIIMKRGDQGEGGEGFYTLKSISSSEDQTSHIISFEDRADATNFCYLLQSFFEELEGFRADVVPLTVQELNEAVQSHGMRAIVVKRGQLRLYAGQPLDDAETALRDLSE